LVLLTYYLPGQNFFIVVNVFNKMSVNLNKNKAAILDAWKKVTANEDGYDWALFGYEGKSYDLKVVSEKSENSFAEKKHKNCFSFVI
jgi:hypothetical protein